MYNTQIYWDGQAPLIKKRTELIEYLKGFPEDSWFEMKVSPIGQTNNTDQSKLYFKWCDLIAQEFGWDSGTEVHEYFKKTYNNGESTKGFDTKQWSEYMTKVLAFAGGHNITLPTGNQ